jgi:hypothetical protein
VACDRSPARCGPGGTRRGHGLFRTLPRRRKLELHSPNSTPAARFRQRV